MKKQHAILFSLAIVYLVVSAVPAAAVTDFSTVENYEKNMFLPGFDLWVNQSTTVFALALQSAHQSWELVHYMVFPDSISRQDLQINDPSVRLRFIFGGANMDTVDAAQDNGIALQGGSTKSEIGYTSFDSRDTNSVNNMPVADGLSADAGVLIDTRYDSWNASTFSNISQNYTVPETRIQHGVQYVADDSKSVVDYSRIISEGDGATYYNVHNASMIGFTFGLHDEFEGLAWAYDQQASGTALALKGFALRRARVWLHNAKYQAQKWTGSVKRTVDNTVFKPLKTYYKGLASIPAKATHFFTKTIPKAFQGAVSKVVSFGKGIIGSVMKFLPLILGILVVAAIGYMYFQKKLMFSAIKR